MITGGLLLCVLERAPVAIRDVVAQRRREEFDQATDRVGAGRAEEHTRGRKVEERKEVSPEMSDEGRLIVDRGYPRRRGIELIAASARETAADVPEAPVRRRYLRHEVVAVDEAVAHVRERVIGGSKRGIAGAGHAERVDRSDREA